MARTAITPQSITRSGLEATYTAANADGNSFVNGKNTFIHVKNGATNVVVTLQIGKLVDGQGVTDPTVTVTAATEQLIGPFPPDIYNQSDGTVYIDYDDTSNVTVAVLKLGL